MYLDMLSFAPSPLRERYHSAVSSGLYLDSCLASIETTPKLTSGLHIFEIKESLLNEKAGNNHHREHKMKSIRVI